MKAQRAQAWQPSGGVVLHPVPFKLLRVKGSGGEEYVAGLEYGDYQDCAFDPWQRGDLVVVSYKTRTAWQPGHQGSKEYESWTVGTRHSIPSAPRPRVAFGPNRIVTIGGPSGIDGTLWRIPYCHRAAALALVGKEFESREALEAEL